MLKKGAATKDALVQIGRELFAEKGYAAVTMEDFCARSGLSRGGLYRHFASPRAIFIAVLDLDRQDAAGQLDEAISKQWPARDLLRFFVEQQKQEIQAGKGRLSVAVYEFCTTEAGQQTYLEERFAAAVVTLARLIRYGQARGEFVACDAEETAGHIVIFLEGLRLSSAVIPFSGAAVEKQLGFVYRLLVKGAEQ